MRARQSPAPENCSAADRRARLPFVLSFLNAEQERRYGRYAGEPSADQLARHFHLDDADRELSATTKRWDHMRLGFAVQLGTVRFLGTFLDDPADAPAGVVGDMARQLGIGDPAALLAIAKAASVGSTPAKSRPARLSRVHRTLHALSLARWLYALCWTGTDRPSVLFDRATAWLVTEKVLLPGASALERLVARIRARAARRLWRSLARDITRAQRAQLDALLLRRRGRPAERRSTACATGPTCAAAPSWRRAVDRLDEVRALAAGLPAIDHVPPGRVPAWPASRPSRKAQAVARMPEERRMATLLAFVRTLEASAQDDVLDLFDIVVTSAFRPTPGRGGKRARLRTICATSMPRHSGCARACAVLMDETRRRRRSA